MSMTIKELADSLGISKTAIRKRFTDDFRAAHIRTDEKGTIYIDEQGCLEIAATAVTPTNPFAETEETAKTNSGNPEETAANNEEPLLEILRTSIVALQEQLASKDEQIKAVNAQVNALTAQIGTLTDTLQSTTAALTAAQALHAGTMQQQLSMSEEDTVSPFEEETKQKPQKVNRGLFSKLFYKHKRGGG